MRASELQQYLSETEIYRWNCKWDFISSLAAAGDGARNWIFTKYERGFSKERCGSIRTLSANKPEGCMDIWKMPLSKNRCAEDFQEVSGRGFCRTVKGIWSRFLV